MLYTRHGLKISTFKWIIAIRALWELMQCLWLCDFSWGTGECLSRVTPHKLADNLFLRLLICLPDNPCSLSTLSFPLRPIIRSPLWAPSSCSHCGRLYFYSAMMSVTGFFKIFFMREYMLYLACLDSSFLLFLMHVNTILEKYNNAVLH